MSNPLLSVHVFYKLFPASNDQLLFLSFTLLSSSITPYLFFKWISKSSYNRLYQYYGYMDLFLQQYFIMHNLMYPIIFIIIVYFIFI